MHLVAKHNPGAHEQFGELVNVDPVLFVPAGRRGRLPWGPEPFRELRLPLRQGSVGHSPLEVDPGAGQQVNRVLCVDVQIQGELEIELVRADVGRELALLVGEGKAELDDLEQIHVCADRLIVVVGR